MRSISEQDFAAQTGYPDNKVNTRHLLAIGMNVRGLPTSLFTVNSWATGDLMLSASLTHRLLLKMHLDTGHTEIDSVLEGTVVLCADEIRRLLTDRDSALSAQPTDDVTTDQSLEVLSEVTVMLDQKSANL